VTPKGFDSNIPVPPQQELQVKPDKVLVLGIKEDGGIRLNQENVDWGNLPGRLSDIFRTRADHTIYIQAGNDVVFDKVAQVIDVARGSGAGRIGLLSTAIGMK
jgi:biopolymer transport protein ExbD